MALAATNTEENVKEVSKILNENTSNDEKRDKLLENEEIAPTTSTTTNETTTSTTTTTTNTTNTVAVSNNIPDESAIAPNSPSSSSSTSKNQDSIFEPTVDMMVNDFDDEATLEEEEALAAQESEDPTAELSSLQKESDMPIEELLALYNCQPPNVVRGGRSGATKRGKKRRKLSMAAGEGTSSAAEMIPAKKEKKISENIDEVIEKVDEPDESIPVNDDDSKLVIEETNEEKNEGEDDAEEEELSDGETEVDGDVDEDDDDADSKEISQLRKLYPETYGVSSNDKRLLRTISRQQSDEEEDVDYSPDEDDKKKTIMVGSEFQAVIPEGFSKYDDVLPYENEDKLLWDPSRLTEDQTEEYLTKAHEQTKANSSNNSLNINQIAIDNIPCGKHLRDDEQALYLLLQCGHNTEEALRRKRINPVPSTEQMSIWSEEECRNFESVLRLYGKDFHTIKHAKVHTRSVGELVQFYYLWKKTERHDVFANKARLEKKKYNLNPGLTDYMDRFLEELDTTNSTANTTANNSCNNLTTALRERSSSPSSSGIANGVHAVSGDANSPITAINTTAITSKSDEINPENETNSVEIQNTSMSSSNTKSTISTTAT